MRCPKCGLTQITAAACKKCGAPLGAPARPSTTGSPATPRSAARPPVGRAPATGPSSEASEDPAFGLDKYVFQQRLLTVSEKYDLQDEDGNPVLFVERPAHALRNLAALLVGLVVAFVLGAVIFWSVFQLPAPVHEHVAVVVLTFTLGLGLPLVALAYTLHRLGKKRHLGIYRDATKAEKLMEVRQDQTFAWFSPTFTVVDGEERPLAYVNKNLLTEVFRKKWVVRDPEGRVMLVAKEDSITRALLRRFVSQLVLLNFILCRGESDEVIGEFNKKWALRDRYVLDLARDAFHTLDRRVAVAVGVLLDTGERR